MNLLFETHNCTMRPEWKAQVIDRIEALSDPRDPVISARTTVTVNNNETPSIHVSLHLSMRGKNIVVNKRAAQVEAALKLVLDTTKREIRRHYDLRSEHRDRKDSRVADVDRSIEQYDGDASLDVDGEDEAWL